MTVERVLVVPAAGTGSRLGANVPKLLVPVNGRPMIEHLLALHGPIADGIVIVVSPEAESVVAERLGHVSRPVALVVQQKPTGMLDAVLLAAPPVRELQPRRVLITWCDQVAILRSTLHRTVEATQAVPEPDLVLPTCRGERPYVHLVRDGEGRITDVLHRREGDVIPAVGESDAGLFDMSRRCFLDWLPDYAKNPAIGARTQERNFVPFVSWVARRGLVATVPCSEREEAIGINTPEEHALLEAHLRARPGA